MSIQLTPEQQERILAAVHAGAFPTPEDALNAAVAAVEACSPGFEGGEEELEGLLLEGLASREMTEEEFWNSIDRQTNSITVAHAAESGP